MFFRKKSALIISAFLLSFIIGNYARAMPIGTLLYRTSSQGNLYGYNTTNLIKVKNKMISNIYTGHVAIYVGQENGVDYIVEAMPDGIIKLPAKYFLNSRNGEQLVGAKIPKNLSETQRIKIVELAKKMANSNLAYDFDFKKQKGPLSGEWICVGLSEKIYESANITNPLDLSQLQYNKNFYAINITPDGFDNYSVINSENGDCLSSDLEFSKIEANNRTIIPFPEIFGFNAGLEHNNERYFFFPLTQYYQDTLEDVVVDINLESNFSDDIIRGKVPQLSVIFRWSFINNPISSINNLLSQIFPNVFTGSSGLTNNNSNSSNNNNGDNNIDSSSVFDSNLVSDSNSSSSSSSSSLFVNNNSNPSSNPTNNNSNNSSGSIVINENPNPNNLNLNNNTTTNNLNNNENNTNNNQENEAGEENNAGEDLTEAINNLVISRIYTTLNDDYIELYNPSNKTINLAEAGIRLYKTKTSATPSLMMRVGNLADGTYPGGVNILPYGKYLIARLNADVNIREKAQALASRSEFTFTGSGYTIYLSKGVISNDSDEDIIDKVGFGEAKYFETNPFSEILDNHILTRKAKSNSTAISMKEGGSDFNLGNSFDTNNNSFDFVLVSLLIENSSTTNSTSTTTNTNTSTTTNATTINNTTTSTTTSSITTNTNNTNNTGATTNTNTNTNTSTTTDNTTNNNDSENNNQSQNILLSKIYATLNDDYVELYNPNNFSINLEEAGIRLYKTKTSAVPSLMMRLGNVSDGTYPGGVIISPYGKYLITRQSASTEIKSQAQAISSRSEFTFTGDGYTIYLGKGVVSNDSDIDIIDKVGFGSAVYYYGLPASEILDFHVLTRKAQADSTATSMSAYGNHLNLGHGFNSENNNLDFVLVDLNYNPQFNDDDDSDNNSDNDSDNNSDNDSDNNDFDNTDNDENQTYSNYCINPGIYSNNIIHLWHLDEGQGTSTYDFAQNNISEINSIWQEGKFGAGLKQYFDQPYFSNSLDLSFDPNNFTLIFYYKNLFTNSRPTISFSNSINNNFFRIKLYPYNTDFYNIPGVPSRINELKWLSDNDWHLFSWVVNKAENYWALYQDGVEVHRVNMGSSLFIPVDTINIKGDNNYNLMDEIVVFNRALSLSEINQINISNLPLNHSACQLKSEPQANLLNYWNFNDNFSDYSQDLVGSSTFNFASSSKYFSSDNGYLQISSAENYNYFANLPNYNFYNQAVSLSLWFKNNLINSSTESIISLKCQNNKILGLNITNDDLYYYFNNANFKVNDFSQEIFLANNLWHHLVLLYNPYWLRLSLYIDGNLINNWSHNWLTSCLFDEISMSGDYSVDKVGLYSGYLKVSDINYIFNNQKSYLQN